MSYRLKILLVALIVLMSCLCSCSVFFRSYVDASYFNLPSGSRMVISTPIKIKDGTWFLPIDFKDFGSSSWVGGVHVAVKDDIIKIRAFTVLNEAVYGTGVNLGELSDGTYQLQYLNSDGSVADLGKIEIKNYNSSASFAPLR